MTEEYWQEHKKKWESNPYNTNQINHATSMAMQQKNMAKGGKHPKALYVECLKNSSHWRQYAASPKISV